MPGSLILDTSAVLAILKDEPEADFAETAIADAVKDGHSVLAPFVVLVEIEYLAIRSYGLHALQNYMERLAIWPAEVVESDEEWRHETARVKAAGNISFADAWVAALGILRDAPVLHKDPQFESVPGLRTIDIRRPA